MIIMIILGFLFTYIAPLSFVLLVTTLKEAVDDFNRYKRDKELNNSMYEYVTRQAQMRPIKAADMKVGNIIKVKQN